MSLTKIFNRRGIDPVSRAVGLEPEGWATKVTGALGLNPPQYDNMAVPQYGAPLPADQQFGQEHARRQIAAAMAAPSGAPIQDQLQGLQQFWR